MSSRQPRRTKVYCEFIKKHLYLLNEELTLSYKKYDLNQLRGLPKSCFTAL